MIDPGIFNLLNTLKATFFSRVDTDFVDRFNHYYTPLVIVILMAISVMRVTFGTASSCWCPGEVTPFHFASTENYCWMSSTYWIPDDDLPPIDQTARQSLHVKYYLWVPFMFAIQALLNYMPSIFWDLMSWRSGIDMASFSKLASKPDNLDPDKRKGAVNTVAFHIQGVLDLQKTRRHETGKWRRIVTKGGFFCCCVYDWFGGRHSGTYMTACYFFTKFLYIGCIPLQLLILKKFYGYPHLFEAAYMIRSFVNGSDWTQTGHFPRVTLCDVKVRAFGHDRSATVQCVLPVNILYEKFYVFLCCWLSLCGVMTVVNVLSWLFKMLSPQSRAHFIRKYLKLSGKSLYHKGESARVKRFVVSNLGLDGMLVLRLFSLNTNFAFTHDLIANLWTKFRERDDELSKPPASVTPPNLTPRQSVAPETIDDKAKNNLQ
jgi:hypothetical protein